MQRVDQAGGGDDRGAVLVVEDRDFKPFAKLLLDDEAFGRLDVLKIDAAVLGASIATASTNLSVSCVDSSHAVNIGKFLEKDGLALHHRL